MMHAAEFIGSVVTAQRIFSKTTIPPKGKLANPRNLMQVVGAIVNLLDSKFLFASLLWGSIGVGYFIYGKKQAAMIPMIGGLTMIAVSYLVGSWFWMSLTCLALMAGIYWLLKQGY